MIKPDLKKVSIEDYPREWTVPTFFELGSLTLPFQKIVNLYGVPRYKEVNPALFTIITFPYLFGVMFGDVGHGSVLFVLGLIWCCMASKFEKDPSFGAQACYHLRYIILLMGFFSTYIGFIYNEFFAISIPMFNSCYKVENKPNDSDYFPSNIERGLIKGNLIGAQAKDCVYPLGIDWVWSYAESSKLEV